jgi:DNA gyrase subunit B
MLDVVENNAEGDNEDESLEEEVAKTKTQKFSIQRYKGLGEMNPEELKETTMDANKRILKQVTVTDAEGADKVFDMLMGTDVPARKSFITTNAKFANLDV